MSDKFQERFEENEAQKEKRRGIKRRAAMRQVDTTA